jgi:succinoglycan biosynthesis transport protein ExoP
MPPLTPQLSVAPAPDPGSRQNQGYGNAAYASNASGDFARNWRIFVEKGWVAALSTAVFLGLGYAYVRRAPPLYSATATIQAEQDQPDILKIQVVQLKDLQAIDYLQTIAEVLTSRPLLERVADTNQLSTDSRFSSTPDRPLTRAQLLARLDKTVKVKVRHGTRLIDITVTHGVPELTERIANSIVAEYINQSAERVDATIGLANMSLAKEAERLRKKLEESENALQAYKERAKSSSLDDRQNTVVTKLKELSTKATEAKALRIKTETEYSQALNLGTNMEALLNVPTVIKDPNVIALQANLAKAENDFAALCQRYRAKHPKYIQAVSQIAELRADTTNAVLKAVQSLKASLDSARAAEDALDQAMQTQEASALELSKLSIKYSVLAREVESDRALYDAVLKGMKEASITKETRQTGIIHVVQPAARPEVPVSSKKRVILIMSGLSGLILGVLIVMALGFTDTSIKTVDEAETLLGLPVLAVVPVLGEVRKSHDPLVLVNHPRSEGAEAFRTLRTSLSDSGRAAESQVFLFVSAMPGEGKTFCSLNYAASLAQLGLKTLLIDADLRNPSVESSLLGQDSHQLGITDYLTGQNRLLEVCRPTKVENLFFLAGGTIAASPAELLAKAGLELLIKDALQHYDRVVLDSAPINAVSDTFQMLKSVHTVCLVVRAAHTSSRYVLRCVQLLLSAKAPLSGAVLNRTPRHRGLGYGGYYDYRYHGQYGKEGVYGSR